MTAAAARDQGSGPTVPASTTFQAAHAAAPVAVGPPQGPAQPQQGPARPQQAGAPAQQATAPSIPGPAAQDPGEVQAPDAGSLGPWVIPTAESPDEAGESVTVDGRLIESAILALRKAVVAAALPLDGPGVAEARGERRKLLSQIDDYLLPRLRQSGSPVLVALVGSTGAGKSTLVNSLVGAEVSVTGIRRPTTNSPVLACHPDDVGWFAENVFLPTVPRVRQEGLARSGRDGLLVLASSEGMPKGIALLDTPDIDSVVAAHREFAHQFLDASDFWLFMTTAGRYADATVWDLLGQARERGAALSIVLSRVPDGASEILEHFDSMLKANGLSDRQRFLIPETVLASGRLPPELSGPVREWLEDTASQVERRLAVLTQTMSGMLDTFRSRVPALAAKVEEQVAMGAGLAACVEGAYRAALAEAADSLWNGSLLRGEVLAAWQELAGTGDLLNVLEARRGAKQRHQRQADRVQTMKSALRAAAESLIQSVADRAAEDAVGRWRDREAGAALLDRSVHGDGPLADNAQLAADLDLLFGAEGATARRRAGDGPHGPGGDTRRLGRSSPELTQRAARAVSGWQDHVSRLLSEENVTKRSIARTVSLDNEALAMVVMVALLGSAAPAGVGTSAIPHRLLTTLFGAGPLRSISARVKADLLDRIKLLFEEETLRFSAIIDAASIPDAALAVHLYQATYSLEVAR